MVSRKQLACGNCRNTLTCTAKAGKLLRMDAAQDNDTKTRLMTLLNVSQLRTGKRKLTRSALGTAASATETPEPVEKKVKLNKKRVIVVDSTLETDNNPTTLEAAEGSDSAAVEEEDGLHDDDKGETRDYYDQETY